MSDLTGTCFCEIISITTTLLHFFSPTASSISGNKTNKYRIEGFLLIFVIPFVTKSL